MSDPFLTLGISPSADADEVRAAYIALVKQYHPDRFLDPVKKADAQEKLISINLAYEKALKLARPKSEPVPDFNKSMPLDDAVQVALKMLRQGRPQAALRQLIRAESKNDMWYFVHGQALMQLEKFSEAHHSFREAVHRSPGNNEYHRMALQAELADRKSKTFTGKLQRFFKRGKK